MTLNPEALLAACRQEAGAVVALGWRRRRLQQRLRQWLQQRRVKQQQQQQCGP